MFAQELQHRPQPVAPAGNDQRLLQPVRERNHRGGVQMQQRQIGKRGRESLRVKEFRFALVAEIHRFAAVQQNAHGNVLLGLVNFQEKFSEAEIGAPIQRAGIVAKAVAAVIGEFHSRPARARAVLGAHRAGQIRAAQQRDLLQRFQEFAVEQKRRSCSHRIQH